jgi:hypothetical protein
LPQPGDQLWRGWTSELVESAKRFEQRVLDQV